MKTYNDTVKAAKGRLAKPKAIKDTPATVDADWKFARKHLFS